MDTRKSESTPLLSGIDNDAIIQINEEYTLDNIPQDIMNVLSSMLSYQKDLVPLRQTSKKLNALVENTVAGQMNREAKNLDPSLILKVLGFSGLCETTSASCAAIGAIWCYVLLCIFFDWVDYSFAPLIAMGTFFGGGLALGCGSAAILYPLNSYGKNTLFQNRETQNFIRQELRQPVGDFKNRM